MNRKMTTVVWRDAHSTVDELTEEDVRGRHRPNVIHTTGYIVVSDEIGISIAGEWIPSNVGSEESFRNVTCIPKENVISQGVVKRAKKTSPRSDGTPVRGDTQEAEGSLRDVSSETNG